MVVVPAMAAALYSFQVELTFDSANHAHRTRAVLESVRRSALRVFPLSCRWSAAYLLAERRSAVDRNSPSPAPRSRSRYPSAALPRIHARLASACSRSHPLATTRDRFVAFRRSLPRTPPLERQTVRSRGLAFAVFTTPPVDDPDATPLLCINGGMLYDHSMLWPALSPLAQRRQVILYDQRGRGQSEPPQDPANASIEDDATDIGALRRALGIRRWDVLGHSWGGGIALLATSLD